MEISDFSPFLALPVEMRRLIYGYLLEDRYYLGRKRASHHGQHLIPSYSSLMIVSHQIHDEFYPVTLHHAFTTADAILAPIKNFNFRIVHDFLASCTTKQLTSLRTSEPPQLVAEFRTCTHFNEHFGALDKRYRWAHHSDCPKDWESTHLGKWLCFRFGMATEERVPLRYELKSIKMTTKYFLMTYLHIFRMYIYRDQAHKDIDDIMDSFSAYSATPSDEQSVDKSDTSASSDSENEINQRANDKLHRRTADGRSNLAFRPKSTSTDSRGESSHTSSREMPARPNKRP